MPGPTLGPVGGANKRNLTLGDGVVRRCSSALTWSLERQTLYSRASAGENVVPETLHIYSGWLYSVCFCKRPFQRRIEAMRTPHIHRNTSDIPEHGTYVIDYNTFTTVYDATFVQESNLYSLGSSSKSASDKYEVKDRVCCEKIKSQ